MELHYANCWMMRHRQLPSQTQQQTSSKCMSLSMTRRQFVAAGAAVAGAEFAADVSSLAAEAENKAEPGPFRHPFHKAVFAHAEIRSRRNQRGRLRGDRMPRLECLARRGATKAARKSKPPGCESIPCCWAGSISTAPSRTKSKIRSARRRSLCGPRKPTAPTRCCWFLAKSAAWRCRSLGNSTSISTGAPGVLHRVVKGDNSKFPRVYRRSKPRHGNLAHESAKADSDCRGAPA